MEGKSNMAAVHLLEFVVQMIFVHFKDQLLFPSPVFLTHVPLGWNLALAYKCKIQSFLE